MFNGLQKVSAHKASRERSPSLRRHSIDSTTCGTSKGMSPSGDPDRPPCFDLTNALTTKRGQCNEGPRCAPIHSVKERLPLPSRTDVPQRRRHKHRQTLLQKLTLTITRRGTFAWLRGPTFCRDPLAISVEQTNAVCSAGTLKDESVKKFRNRSMMSTKKFWM